MIAFWGVDECYKKSKWQSNSEIVQTVTEAVSNNSPGNGQKQKCLSTEFLLATKTKPLVGDHIQLQNKKENKTQTWNNLIWEK